MQWNIENIVMIAIKYLEMNEISALIRPLGIDILFTFDRSSPPFSLRAIPCFLVRNKHGDISGKEVSFVFILVI